MFNKKHTDETRQKMSKSHTGRSQTFQTIQKRVEKVKGKKRKPFSEETRKKMSESHKQYWLNKKETENSIS